MGYSNNKKSASKTASKSASKPAKKPVSKTASKTASKRAKKSTSVDEQKKKQQASKTPGGSIPHKSAVGKTANKNSIVEKEPVGQNQTPEGRAKELEIEERRELAVEYAKSGLSLRKIARLLTEKGYECSHVTVKEDLDAMFEEAKERQQEKVEQMRWMMDEKYESLYQTFKYLTLKQDVSAFLRIQAGFLCNAILANQSNLHNLNKPKQVEVSGKDGGPLEMKLFGGINVDDV